MSYVFDPLLVQVNKSYHVENEVVSVNLLPSSLTYFKIYWLVSSYYLKHYIMQGLNDLSNQKDDSSRVAAVYNDQVVNKDISLTTCLLTYL